MVPILGTCFDTLRAHNLLSNNNGRGYEFCFLFWVPKMIPILGSCFGTLRAHNLFSNNNGRGYEFWFQLWVSLLVTFLGARCVCVFFARFCDFGHAAAHSSSPPPHTRAAMTNNQPTHRGVPKSVACHSAAHWVVMGSSSGYQKCFPCWSHSAAHWVVIGSCFRYIKAVIDGPHKRYRIVNAL